MHRFEVWAPLVKKMAVQVAWDASCDARDRTSWAGGAPMWRRPGREAIMDSRWMDDEGISRSAFVVAAGWSA